MALQMNQFKHFKHPVTLTIKSSNSILCFVGVFESISGWEEIGQVKDFYTFQNVLFSQLYLQVYWKEFVWFFRPTYKPHSLRTGAISWAHFLFMYFIWLFSLLPSFVQVFNFTLIKQRSLRYLNFYNSC